MNIEDNLSDKLHQELTRSFIDKKISILSKGLKQDLVLKTEVSEENKVDHNKYITEFNKIKPYIDIIKKLCNSINDQLYETSAYSNVQFDRNNPYIDIFWIEKKI